MKCFLFFLLVVISFSCSKYKLNQPCTLELQSDYISSSNPNDEKFSGTLNVTSITFSGQREKGDPVEIKKELSEKTMALGEGVVFDTPIDIPVGTYTSYNIKVSLSANNSLRISKNVTNGANKPILIEIDEVLDLTFTAKENTPELEKKQIYQAVLVWNFNQLFAGLSSQSINNSPTVFINGIETVVISSTSNTDKLTKIKSNLSKALELKIE